MAIHRSQPAAADQLLARAYTEKRTLELRIAGAGYAPLRVSARTGSVFYQPSGGAVKGGSADCQPTGVASHRSVMAASAAKADVLEGKYDAAVEACAGLWNCSHIRPRC